MATGHIKENPVYGPKQRFQKFLKLAQDPFSRPMVFRSMYYLQQVSLII